MNVSKKYDENANVAELLETVVCVYFLWRWLTHPKLTQKSMWLHHLYFKLENNPGKLNERCFRALKYTLLGLSGKQFRNYGRLIKTLWRDITLKCLLTLYFYFHRLRSREAVFTDDLKLIGCFVLNVHCKERDVCSCFCYIRCYSSLKRCSDKF